MSTNVPDITPSKPAEPPRPVAPPTASTEGLPDYEPLTPELVEEEAIRGDFVLKWSVILLAVLLASTLVAETTTLVHVKTGQYLASHGLLPPGNDVFSTSAGERRWVNLSWLFDLLLAGVYGVGRFMGLSGFKAILAGLAFGFVAHTSKPGISTWWGSICAALAILVCQPRFTAQPEVVTLLGIALCLWLLHKAVWMGNPKFFWMLIPVCAVWSNLDDRAWWGPYLLGLYGVGELLGSLVGRSAISDLNQRKTLWLAIGGSWLGLLINPFLWQSFVAPFTQFGTTYPTLSKIYSGRNFLFFDSFSLLDLQGSTLETSITLLREPVVFCVAYTLCLLTVVVFVLNYRRLTFGHMLMFFGALVPVLFAVHELGAAALVLCVLATVNGQIWYSNKYSRVYSIELRALLFSRGGRALTVLGLFSLALLFTFGRLQPGGISGPTGARTPGWGLDTELDGVVRSMQTVMQDAPQEGTFNFTPEQGDVLIWLGCKPFIDSRVAIYAGQNDSDLVSLHLKLRSALAPRTDKEDLARQTPAQIQLWKKEFDERNITMVLPRLTSFPSPDYRTFSHLVTQRKNWQLTRIGAATALFVRVDKQSPELKTFMENNRFDLGDAVFKTEAELLPARVAWPQLPTFYQRYIWKQDKRISEETQEARHRLILSRGSGSLGVGMVYQAIRRAQESLARNVNDTHSYQLLGEAYLELVNIESPGNLNSLIGKMRYIQAVQALNLAVVADPDNREAHFLLIQLYRAQRRPDLELRELQAIAEIIRKQSVITLKDEQRLVQDEELIGQQIDVVNKQIAAIEQEIAKLPKEVKDDQPQLAMYYSQAGMVLKALELLEPDESEVAQPPQVTLARAHLLLEAGQAEMADELTRALEGLAAQMEFSGWQQPRVYSLLASAEYTQAAQILVQEIANIDRQSQQAFLEGFMLRSNEWGQPPAPLNWMTKFFVYYETTSSATAAANLQAGLIYLEAGQIKQATESFEKSLKQSPNQSDRAMVAYYLTKMTGKWVDGIAPGDRVPADIFPK